MTLEEGIAIYKKCHSKTHYDLNNSCKGCPISKDTNNKSICNFIAELIMMLEKLGDEK